LFTTVGAPQIWNGEEMGMWGADDPYGRKPLMWKEMKFEPENRNNISKQKPVYDKVRFDQATFNFYKKLIQIRKENPVLVDGETDFLLTEGKKLIYKRYTDTSEIIVVFNLEAKTQTVQLADGNYVDLITGKSINGKNLKVKSMEGFILKQNN
jgi:glycosidase